MNVADIVYMVNLILDENSLNSSNTKEILTADQIRTKLNEMTTKNYLFDINPNFEDITIPDIFKINHKID